jgi:hypothetical protein
MQWLMNGLRKLPEWHGTTLYRGEEGNHHAHLREGQGITWWAFTSTTVRLQALTSFLPIENERVVFELRHVRNARSIAAFSEFRNEEEVLILPGTRFRVDQIASGVAAPGLTQIVLIAQ